MGFRSYLAAQIGLHPSVMPKDLVKLSYQAAFGAEHLLLDEGAAERRLLEEFERTEAKDLPLFEEISENFCRINIAAWRWAELPPEWLFRIFRSARPEEGGEEHLRSYLSEAREVVRGGGVRFSLQEFDEYLEEYQKAGMPPVRHSEEYRLSERPAYRIASSRYIRALPILREVRRHLSDRGPTVIAIDGRAASGKTTLAALLAEVLPADTVHTDDFFLPPELRSEARLLTPGENIHRERFTEEVIPHLAGSEPFSYRIFDCARMDYYGERRVGSLPFRIVEGSYSTHPAFGDYAAVTVFSDVRAEEQKRRILLRNGEEMLGRFLARWIPLEEEYFKHFNVAERASIRV